MTATSIQGSRRRFFTRRILLPVFLILAVFLLVSRLLPAPLLFSQVTSSRIVVADDGSLMRLTLASDDQYRLWTALENFPQHTVQALLLKEDRAFYFHPGVSPSALIRALWRTYLHNDRQGGSTLTMQLARRLYHLHTRNVPGKLKQMFLAFWLEARYSKAAILEAYLNLAPMGANIEGFPAAALIYFDKEIRQVSLAESIALAVLPQKPSQRGRFNEEQQQARQQLAAKWVSNHPEDHDRAAAEQATLVGRSRQQLPFVAPHLAQQLLAQHPQRQDEQRIETNLNPRLQKILERLVHQYLGERSGSGIVNATALLVDRRTMAVRAMVGSADFFNTSIQGQVNGIRGKRSPGSTLKPFIYGLALDQGLIHPLSILYDAPSAFGPYQPENFDGRFAGPISAKDALIRSRNVPAITLASQLKNPNLHGLLKSAGVGRLRSAKQYGLTLALGGGELSMEELAGLYAMLANDGMFRPLRYLRNDQQTVGTSLLSPQAAFLVKEMLRANPRPGHTPAGARNHGWKVAWKTGTSWGFRDAWSVGLVGDYVLAVWVGNFDGRPNPSFVSLKAAAPLFFRIADALPLTLPEEHPEPETIPAGVSQVEVCTASGDLPNHWCPQKSFTWFIPGTSPIRVSTLHRPVYIDQRTGKAACPPFDPMTTRTEIFEFWPSDIQTLFREAGLPRRLPPEPDSRCPQAAIIDDHGEAPRIQSPLTYVTYTLHASKPDEIIDLHASVGAESESIYWFADNRFLGHTTRDLSLPWRPVSSGRIEITAVDEHGRSSSRQIEVTFIP